MSLVVDLKILGKFVFAFIKHKGNLFGINRYSFLANFVFDYLICFAILWEWVSNLPWRLLILRGVLIVLAVYFKISFDFRTQPQLLW